MGGLQDAADEKEAEISPFEVVRPLKNVWSYALSVDESIQEVFCYGDIRTGFPTHPDLGRSRECIRRNVSPMLLR